VYPQPKGIPLQFGAGDIRAIAATDLYRERKPSPRASHDATPAKKQAEGLKESNPPACFPKRDGFGSDLVLPHISSFFGSGAEASFLVATLVATPFV
jgi:hypothetical protein